MNTQNLQNNTLLFPTQSFSSHVNSKERLKQNHLHPQFQTEIYMCIAFLRMPIKQFAAETVVLQSELTYEAVSMRNHYKFVRIPSIAYVEMYL